MANPESAAGKAIHGIQDRLQRAQIVKNTFGVGQSAEERLLAAIIGANTPIARATESIISPERAQGIVARTEVVRDWIINNAPSYDKQPSSRRDDEEGWAYTGGGFEMSADDMTKPSNVVTLFRLSIVETSLLHEPSADVWFAVESNGYDLEIKFYGKEDERRERRLLQEYISDNKTFEEMPEEDAAIIEDLLTRVTSHLTEQTQTEPEERA